MGEYVYKDPLQMAGVAFGIFGVGLTVTSSENVAPVQPPAVGVTV